jgi:hypothetical protein
MVVFPYSNPIFQPAIRQIASLSPVYSFDQLILTVTTTQDHLYNNGLTVRLNIPLEYQAQQINSLFSEIVVTSATQFIMTLPPIQFDAFTIPGTPLQVPLIIPIAEDVLLLNSAVVNTLFNPQL